MNDLIAEIIKFIGGISVAIAAIAWLTKKLICHLLDRDVKTFMAKINFILKNKEFVFGKIYEKEH